MNKAKQSVRELALDLLLQIEQQQAYSNLLINKALEQSGFMDRDRALLTNLVYGTIQRKNTLDFYLGSFLKKELKKKDQWVRVLLRLSMFQMLYLDRVPDHAVIHEAVEIAKRRGHTGLGSLVNGVLRKVQRTGVADLNEMKDDIKRLSLIFSTPEWLIEKWIKQYGREETEKMAMANLQPAPVTARVNLLKATREEVLDQLKKEGIDAVKGELSNNAIIIKSGHLPSSEAYRNGWLTIQDESSMLVAHAVNPSNNETVLDSCAAPGGKTTHLAELMGGKGKVISLDLHEHKVKLIAQQAERLHLENIEIRALDARKSPEHFKPESFDRILVDAPCTGFGVIRKKPDMKWTKKAQDVEQLASIQKRILQSVVPLLKPGGHLVYSTCTVDREENQDMAMWLLEECKELAWDEKFKENVPESILPYITAGQSEVQILPHYFNSDGFYIAAFQKKTSGGETDA